MDTVRSVILAVVVGFASIGCSTTPPRASVEAGALIELSSPTGVSLLRSAEGFAEYVRLSAHVESQRNTAYCGVATAVAVLNTLGVPGPPAERIGDARYFTQENFFTPAVELALASEKVRKQGMTLQEFVSAITQHPGARAKAYHADEAELAAFRRIAREVLDDPFRTIVTNYHRPTIGQPGPGHISPIAAYDSSADRFLILDVSRYKYPPVWIAAPLLWDGMLAVDGEAGRSRGFAVVSADRSE